MKQRTSEPEAGSISATLRIEDLELSVPRFTDFYRALIALRFPLPIDDVLELRAIINHAADKYRQAELTRDGRHFRDALERAIGSFGIHKRHHRERLIRVLCLLRDTHAKHSHVSHGQEASLRDRLDRIAKQRAQALREGMLTFFLTIVAGLLWLGLTDPHWLLQLVVAASAVISWRRFHSLPTLESDAEILRMQINAILRLRIKSIKWKTLIHKLALILGYKQIRGIEVFNMAHGEPHEAYA